MFRHVDGFTKPLYIDTTGLSKDFDALGQLLRRKFSVFHFFSLNIVNNTICLLIVCPLWTDASIFSFVTSLPLLQKNKAHMAIKALKQSVSISETQKMIHQWKGRGINDPTITKLLDLYLGMPAYMNSQGIYPHCNFYDIRLSLRFSYTSTLVAAVTNCLSFGMIWDEPHTKVIAFYSPLWYRQENGNPTESPQNPAQETPQDSALIVIYYII